MEFLLKVMLWDVKTLAESFKVDERYVEALIEEEHLPALILNKEYRIRLSDLNSWINERVAEHQKHMRAKLNEEIEKLATKKND